MSTIAVFLALGGGSFAAVSGGKDGGDKGGQHQKGDGSGGNGGSDQGGQGDQGGKDKGGKGGNGGNNGGDNAGSNDSTGGDANAIGSLGITTRDGDPVSTDGNTDEAVATASCEKDERLVGGGVRTESEKDRVRGQSVQGQPVVMSSGPDGDGWSARVVNSSGLGGVRATAYAICASTSK